MNLNFYPIYWIERNFTLQFNIHVQIISSSINLFKSKITNCSFNVIVSYYIYAIE